MEPLSHDDLAFRIFGAYIRYSSAVARLIGKIGVRVCSATRRMTNYVETARVEIVVVLGGRGRAWRGPGHLACWLPLRETAGNLSYMAHR